MEGQAGASRKGFEEVRHQRRRHRADHGALQGEVDDGIGSATAIERHQHPRFVERHRRVTVAGNATPVTERFRQRFTQHQRHVFHGVVRVDVEVARCPDVEIDPGVQGEGPQQVIEEG